MIVNLCTTVRCSLASYPGRVGGEKRPGINCLRMRDHSQKNLGIRLRLEIVGKINTDTSDIYYLMGEKAIWLDIA